MKTRNWSFRHKITGSDLSDIGIFAEEAIGSLSTLISGSSRLHGLQVQQALVVGDSVLVKAGYGTVQDSTAGRNRLFSLGSDASVSFAGKTAGTYLVVGTLSQLGELNETIAPPPENAPNGDNPYFIPGLASYNLDTVKRWSMVFSVESNSYVFGDGQIAFARVVWNGVSIVDANITQLLLLPTLNIQDKSIPSIKIADAIAGAGLTRDGAGNLKVNTDNSSLEVLGDTLIIKDAGVTDGKLGNRTIDQSLVPTGNTGSLTNQLSWLANRVKAITGKANWSDDPSHTLESLYAAMARKASAETIGGSWTFNASPSVPTPTTGNAAVNKTYADAITTALNNHKTSGDHDSRYMLKTGGTTQGGFIFDSDADSNIILRRSSTGYATELEFQTSTARRFRIWQTIGSEDLIFTAYSGTAGSEVGTEMMRIQANTNDVLIKGSKVWHAGNDGSGSGLDADKLDNYESSDFPRKAENAIVSGNWSFASPISGSITGNAGTATSAGRWTTARTLTLTGAVTGSVAMDGSGNVSLNTTYGSGLNGSNLTDGTVSNAKISGLDWSKITNRATTLSGYGITDAVKNGGGVGLWQAGTLASRPTIGLPASGAYYHATDEDKLYRWTGSAWVAVLSNYSGVWPTARTIFSQDGDVSISQNPGGGYVAGVTMDGSSNVYATLFLNNNSVTTSKVADAAITNPKLADNSVGTSKIQNYSVTASKLDSSSVGLGNLKSEVIGAFTPDMYQSPAGNGYIHFGGNVFLQWTRISLGDVGSTAVSVGASWPILFTYIPYLYGATIVGETSNDRRLSVSFLEMNSGSFTLKVEEWSGIVQDVDFIVWAYGYLNALP